MPPSTKSIVDIISQFDRVETAIHIQKGEQERQEILARFPLSAWPELPLEKYALGLPTSVDAYCRWVEFNSPHLGSMRGGSATKHLIYKHLSKPGWYYYPPTMKDEQEAWQAIRGDFVKAFELAKQGQWEEIDTLRYLLGGRALRIKTLHIYFPEEILSICSIHHIRHFLDRLGVWKAEMGSWEAVKLNRTLFSALRAIPKLKDFSTGELERLLYFWADPRETRRVVKIAPGEGARFWADCLEHGYICVGWDAVGDLRNFESKEPFQRRFEEAYSDEHNGHQPTLTKKGKELWTLMELEPGDVVIANEGISKILAVGEVVDPGYTFRPEREEYQHTVAVKWDTSYAQEIDPLPKWAFKTVDPVSAALHQQILAIGGTSDKSILTVEEPFLTLADALERKGQGILYGPPGTGKTYIARRFAVWWLLQQQNERKALAVLADPERFKAEERKLSTSTVAQRVWWFVANPREWSWDKLFKEKRVEYRYGRLQRNYPLVQAGDLVIGYQSRPDKRIMALGRVLKGIDNTGKDEPKIEIGPLLPIQKGPTYEDLLQDPVLKESEPMRNRCQGTLFALNSDEAQYLLDLLSESTPEVGKYMTSGEGIGHLTWITFHPSYSYEDFVEGYRPVEASTGLTLKLADGIFKRICREAQAHPKEKYLLIIDEINRANLAKVFGELITLLEKDKRGLTITLPQSKETFTIPPNVYVLGTMNTADRSIKLLDVALRRRFAFFELMPDPELLNGSVINGLELDSFLEALNKRIAETEGREKQIGHALLMEGGRPITEPEEFACRFRQDILPLLQEYCYEDYTALQNYLGKKLVDADTNSLKADVIQSDASLIEALIELIGVQG